MEYRKFLGSGFQVPLLSYGTATFGGKGEFFKAWGSTDVKEASRLIDICIEHGANFLDSANIYSQGLSEEILGEALKGRRQKVILSTKASFTMGQGQNNFGSSRIHLVRECEASLKRLQTDHIELFYMHGFDSLTPVEETLRALDDLITAGKISYIGCSNFSGWHLMKSLSASEKNSYSRYIAHQVYYSLVGRDYEWELMPLAQDQKVSAVVWSPLAGGALTGKVSRRNPAPEGSRAAQMDFVVSSKSEHLYTVVDALTQIAQEVEKSVTQVALNWVMHRPTVASVVVGARTEEQLLHNFGALGWTLSVEQVKRLDEASRVRPPYPYWHQAQSPNLMPPMV
ncbi:MAG: aldo/keto reductase [Proteobacteria bacterium]|nr:MAG: aldo/keto reductase [Pseudomonadota bacterium]